MTNLRDILENQILPQVEKPSRYLGNELNTVHKRPEGVDLRVCLFFPDLYELGLGNLGLHILYAALNGLEGVWAERGYTPAPDMEAKLRERGLPLFLYESKDPMAAADLIGFTLQSELTFTNILNAIDLAGLPLRSADRTNDAPLLFAGGPAVFNPEPLAPFIDFFVIGDGEDAVIEMAETLRPLKGAPKLAKLEALAKLEGFYVPALYPFETLPDGQILPKEDAPKIVKRITKDLDGAVFPADYIVPTTQLVHDGIGLEVLRGCTQGCRFCQAGMVTRPVRERSLSKIDELMQRTLDNTGLDAVSLVSLSTCDFSRPRTLVKQAAQRARPEQVSVSLPSLRLDSFAVEMADMVSDVRRSGLTFAPEAATPRLRAVINKFIPDEELLTMAEEAYKRGWSHIKTYFMIGLPTERDEDVEAIADLCIRTVEAGRRITRKAAVRTGVSTFVPKPFTPFQWAAQIDIEETHRKQRLLSEKFRGHPEIKFGRHTPETSFIEGLLTRADRRAADLLEAAWRRGARLESWDEHVRIDYWLAAIEETGFDVAFQLRERNPEERLPWDHIDVMIPKEWFQKDWHEAQELKYAQDCRAGKCHLCGVIYRERELCHHMLKNQKRGRREEEESWEGVPDKAVILPEPVQRLRLRIGRTGETRFLSHLEMKDAWTRALRRAKAPLAYSQGFHAQPKITFATATPVGEESLGDYMDVLVHRYVDVEEFRARLDAATPPGLHVFGAFEMPLRGPALMSLVDGFTYRIETGLDANEAALRTAALMALEEIPVERKTSAAKRAKKKGNRRGGRGARADFKTTLPVDIRPLITRLETAPGDAGTEIVFETRALDNRLAKPREIIALLELDPTQTRVRKTDTMLREDYSVELSTVER